MRIRNIGMRIRNIGMRIRNIKVTDVCERFLISFCGTPFP